MLLELTVIPLGRTRSIGSDIAQVVGVIDGSGLDYQVTDFGTLLEGTWEQLMDVVKCCHDLARSKTDRVLLLMRLDDYGGQTGLLHAGVKSVERHLGRGVKS